MSLKNYFFISCLFAKIRSEVSIIVEAYFYTIVGRKSELVITHSWRRHTYAQLPIVRISDWFSFECQLLANYYPNQFLVLWFFIQLFTMNLKIYKCILSTWTPCIYISVSFVVWLLRLQLALHSNKVLCLDLRIFDKIKI